MKLFNFSFTNEENIIFLLLILIMIIMIISIINKPSKSENQAQNNMWVPYEQFEPIEPTEPQLELVFPGKSFEAPIIDEPYVVNQLEEQQKQVNLLKEQVPISSLNNDQILMMSQEPSYNFLPLIQKLFGASNDNTVSQEMPQVISQEMPQVIPQVMPQVLSQEPEESNYAGFNNEIDYTTVEQTQIPVEQKVTNFNYNKSIEQVDPNDMIDNYSSF